VPQTPQQTDDESSRNDAVPLPQLRDRKSRPSRLLTERDITATAIPDTRRRILSPDWMVAGRKFGETSERANRSRSSREGQSGVPPRTNAR
jgi:hypothetical protein